MTSYPGYLVQILDLNVLFFCFMAGVDCYLKHGAVLRSERGDLYWQFSVLSLLLCIAVRIIPQGSRSPCPCQGFAHDSCHIFCLFMLIPFHAWRSTWKMSSGLRILLKIILKPRINSQDIWRRFVPLVLVNISPSNIFWKILLSQIYFKLIFQK